LAEFRHLRKISNNQQRNLLAGSRLRISYSVKYIDVAAPAAKIFKIVHLGAFSLSRLCRKSGNERFGSFSLRLRFLRFILLQKNIGQPGMKRRFVRNDLKSLTIAVFRLTEPILTFGRHGTVQQSIHCKQRCSLAFRIDIGKAHRHGQQLAIQRRCLRVLGAREGQFSQIVNGNTITRICIECVRKSRSSGGVIALIQGQISLDYPGRVKGFFLPEKAIQVLSELRIIRPPDETLPEFVIVLLELPWDQ
jgi:hypothetical protein